MNKNKLLMTAAAVACLSLYGAQPAEAVTDTMDIDAVIVAAITVNCTTPLNFGSIQAGTGVSTVRVATDDSVSVPAGDATAVGAGQTAGDCALTGDSTLGYTVTIADTVVTGPGTPATDMAVTNFVVTDGTTETAEPYDANFVAGAAAINLGADLTVAASGTQTAGTYAGTATVDVTYQ